MPGRGNLMLTGSLGDVMKESAQTALSYLRSQAASLGVDASDHAKVDIHILVPAGAVPKDGPSAGVTITAALAYFDGYRSARLPANLLQAQRDYFGAHTYERVDKPRGEFFHTNWTGRGGDTSASTYIV